MVVRANPSLFLKYNHQDQIIPPKVESVVLLDFLLHAFIVLSPYTCRKVSGISLE